MPNTKTTKLASVTRYYCIVVPRIGKAEHDFFRGMKRESSGKWSVVLTETRRAANSFQDLNEANAALEDLARYMNRTVGSNHPGLYLTEWY